VEDDDDAAHVGGQAVPKQVKDRMRVRVFSIVRGHKWVGKAFFSHTGEVLRGRQPKLV